MKKKVTADFTAHWKRRIGDQELEKKLGLYSTFKQEFRIDKYLDMPSFRNRQIISKFLCSNHKLRIETERHNNPIPPREERICKLCDMNKVEDETHFILECPRYNQIRRESPIPFEKYNNPQSILHMEEPSIVADFLRKAYSKRELLTMEPVDFYRIKEKSKNGMKLLLCKGKNTPGRLKVCNVTKDGLRLKICRTSTITPFGTQPD